MPVSLICDVCAEEYSVKPSRKNSSRFCSNECKNNWQSENITGENHHNWSREEVNCSACSETFYKKRTRIERSDADLCSEECRQEYWSNNIAPEIDSPGESVELDCSYCNDKIVKPESRTLYDKTFCNKDCYGKWLSENNVGESHPNYSGGSTEKFTVYEKRKIFERDEYTCQDCGERGGRLNAHHIEAASENSDKIHDIDNGMTLCVECHAERHPKLRSLILS